MSYVSDFVRNYLLRFLLIFSGFMVLILAYGQWTSGYFLIYPTGSVAAAVEAFMQEGVDQDQDLLDDTVRGLRALDIRTGDEIERLYNAICKMASNTAEQMRSMRHYSEATAQMQNGLIVTMADMVESRDSDTGAHVQKTAAYVRIILEGLKRKGYYAGKLTPKFMTDCESSAPLHDVGKINIPDAVLNKPGKLTDEEYSIIKSHSAIGAEVLNPIRIRPELMIGARYHHERFDGSGYPDKLTGKDIPRAARIIAVADAYDAMTSDRSYRRGMMSKKVYEEIAGKSGSQFDPEIADIMLAYLRKGCYNVD
jgi:HD-GYP domain-containing protein (c-di-GMP phosphodiesterase class II)